jgi:hypothetical protein
MEAPEEWVFNLLANVAIKLNGPQKAHVLSELERSLKIDRPVTIELKADDGSAVGFRSDSIVAWTKVMPPREPSPILPVPGGIVRAG